MEHYTVAVIGGGVVGCLITRELTKYNTSTVLLEAREDVATGATGANSAIAHGGFDPLPGTLKALLNVRGTAILPKLCAELGVPYRNNGSIVLAFSEEEMQTVKMLYERGEENGATGLSVLNAEELHALEPNVSENAVGALRSESAGILCPYGLAIAAAGNAIDNGATLYTNSPVQSIRKEGDVFRIQAGEHEISADYVINCAGVHADEIARMIGDESFTVRSRKGEYLLFDKTEGNTVSHTLFQVPSAAGKGILVSPTVDGNLLIGPTSDFTLDKADRDTDTESLSRVRNAALRSVPGLNFRAVITSFAGVRAVPFIDGKQYDDFLIRPSEKDGKFLHVAGIESPGLTASPAIAEYILPLLEKAGLDLQENPDFRPNRRPMHWFRHLSAEEKNEVIRNDRRYGQVVCRCETVTEGEIVEAIHTAPKATTVDAIKHRLRSGMGRCQGGFCTPLITNILARELGISPLDVQKSAPGSFLLTGETKED